MRTGGWSGCGLRRSIRGILSFFLIVAWVAPATASYADKLAALSQRERAFLQTVFSGDEAKAVEYAQVAGINVNSIAGEPLSVWFYRLGTTDAGRTSYREPSVQHIVFERFHQNANPTNVGDTNLANFCNYAPFPNNFNIEANGSPDQRRALAEQQAAARLPHLQAMGNGFDSLIKYGLRDKAMISEIFLGCYYRATPLNATFYDTVLARMLRAGANINVEADNGERVIYNAVRTGNAIIAEKLIRDGAQADYLVRLSGFDKPVAGEACTPRLSRSLYELLFQSVRPRNPDALVEMVRVLSLGGLSPMTKYGHFENRGVSRECIYSSFYDAIVDTGNLDLAKRVKEAVVAKVSAAPALAPKAQAAAALPPATSSPVEATVVSPTQIGAWQVATDNGRLVAVAKADKKTSNGFAALRLECVGGHLEYAPVALKVGPMTSLWITVAGDAKEMKLVNQRASGVSASTLSNEFAANEPKAGEPPDWGVEMTVQNWNSAGDSVVMTGFSTMRAFMRAHCKS